MTSSLSQGFDEFMNLTIDKAEEVSAKGKTKKYIGRLLLKVWTRERGHAFSFCSPSLVAIFG